MDEIVGRARAVSEMSDLPFEAIVNFYQTEEEVNGNQAIQD